MNEEELHLLRVAVGNFTNNVEPASPIVTAQPTESDIADIGDLPEDVLDNLIAQLQEGLPQQSEHTALDASIPDIAKGTSANSEFRFDLGLLEQITIALAQAGNATSVGEDSVPRACEAPSAFCHVDNSQDSSPNPEYPNHMLRQRQQQAGILISNELYRQKNAEVLGDDDPEKAAERERIREENRERKKKWRESNQDRNKDNDLRCRVNKKALRIYGVHSSPAKSAFIDSEFSKRKQKREHKEQARGNSSSSSHMLDIQQWALSGFRKGDLQSQSTMGVMVDLVMKAPPEVFAGLRQVAAEISLFRIPLISQSHDHLAFSKHPSQPLAPVPQPQANPQPPPPPAREPESSEPTTLEGLLQRFAASDQVPEGFDLILAELAGETSKPPTPEPEAAVEKIKEEPLESPKLPVEMEIDSELDGTSVDELLAALAAADSDTDQMNGSETAMVDAQKHCNANDDRLEDLAALLGSELEEGLDFDITEETLAKIITKCGIDLSNAEAVDLTSERSASPDDAITQRNEGAAINIPPGVLESMTTEEINQLLGSLNNAEDTECAVTPMPPQGISAEYTPEDVAAILTAIFEGFPSPPLSPPGRRQLPPPPHPVPCNINVLRPQPPPCTDAKRLPLKPPPYMPMPMPPRTGTGVGKLPIPLPPKPKTGEEQKKIKAMGFPPLMAGVKRKAE